MRINNLSLSFFRRIYHFQIKSSSLRFSKKLKLFFALSRIYHVILDIAAPAFCTILWLGELPSPRVIIIGTLTALSGYLSIYSLNDIIGLQADKEKFSLGKAASGYSVEATDYHHPLARGLLSYYAGLAWMIFWSLGAIIGAYSLNPMIILIFIIGGILEFIYCRLLKVTHWRFILSGFVKTCGPMAAVFAVDSFPSSKLLLLFFWVFLWEIGGQNIPADWNDRKEDLRLGAKTIAIRFSLQKTSLIILISLIFTILLSCLLPLLTPLNLSYIYIIGNLGIGYYLLLRPAINFYKINDGSYATRLFDRASYYPLALLILISIHSIIFWD